ncbi:MAG: hypothetical protein CHACPFDD_03791 [Phycisphaerae bacterium]|nr:hypothetical protein [Phycisphaerae bacterium]
MRLRRVSFGRKPELVAALIAGLLAAAADATAWPRRADATGDGGAQDEAGRRVVCRVTADTTLVATPADRNVNAGKLDRLHASATERYALLKFDLSRLEGYEIVSAELRLRRADEQLARVGLSTVAGDWEEGTGHGWTHGAKPGEAHPSTLDEAEGGATYSYAVFRRDPQRARPWAFPGSDFADVSFGAGGSRWVTAAARLDVASGAIVIDVPPELLTAVTLGVQPGGLCVADDFHRAGPRPTVHARESQYPPVLLVTVRPRGDRPAEPPRSLAIRSDALGLEWLTFEAPRALGFEAYLATEPVRSAQDLDGAEQLPTWAMPAPGEGARRILLSHHHQSQHRHVAVRTCEASGVWSAPVSIELPPLPSVKLSVAAPTLERHALPIRMERPFTCQEDISISRDGRYMRVEPECWWDPLSGPVRLQAGRNEFVAFQVILAGEAGTYALETSPWESPGLAEPAPQIRLYRAHYPRLRLGNEKYVPEIAVPIAASEPLKLALEIGPEQGDAAKAPRPDDTAASEAARAGPPAPQASAFHAQAIHVECRVPHHAPRGVWRTRVSVTRDGAKVLDTPVELEVVDAELSDALSFQVSLTVAPSNNAAAREGGVAGSIDWEWFYALHRMAHEHRATAAVLPYSAQGAPLPDFAPIVVQSASGQELIWDEWDRRFGRLFDGSLFRSLPREGVPVQHFILPLNESWPSAAEWSKAAPRAALAERYHPRPTWFEGGRAASNPPLQSYLAWPPALSNAAGYQHEASALVRAFAAHIAQQGWKDTRFQIFLNPRLHSRRSLSWFRVPDPEIRDDILGLRALLAPFRAALGPGRGAALDVRADMAWANLPRESLDGMLDVCGLGVGLFEKNDLVVTSGNRFGEVWSDTGDVAPQLGWNAVLRWAWSARMAGAKGLILSDAWGAGRDWELASENAILLPAATPAQGAVFASLRLKALRRAQQDMEWLEARIARSRAAGIAEGYELATVARELITRAKARFPERTTLLPLLKWDRNLDTVALEEVRRGLRQR